MYNRVEIVEFFPKMLWTTVWSLQIANVGFDTAKNEPSSQKRALKSLANLPDCPQATPSGSNMYESCSHKLTAETCHVIKRICWSCFSMFQHEPRTTNVDCWKRSPYVIHALFHRSRIVSMTKETCEVQLAEGIQKRQEITCKIHCKLPRTRQI